MDSAFFIWKNDINFSCELFALFEYSLFNQFFSHPRIFICCINQRQSREQRGALLILIRINLSSSETSMFAPSINVSPSISFELSRYSSCVSSIHRIQIGAIADQFFENRKFGDLSQPKNLAMFSAANVLSLLEF